MSDRTKQTYVVFGFASTHDALDAERLLDDMGVDAVPIPAPKTIGATCGIALRVPVDEAERADTYLSRAEIHITARVDIEDF